MEHVTKHVMLKPVASMTAIVMSKKKMTLNLATVLQDVQTPGSVMFTGVMTPVITKPVIGTEEIVTKNTVPVEIPSQSPPSQLQASL